MDKPIACMIYDAHLPSMTARFRMGEGFPLAGGIFEIRRIRTATEVDKAKWSHLPDPPEEQD